MNPTPTSANTVAPLYTLGRPVFSVEFFPPKTEAGLETTQNLIAEFRDLPVDYMTVTYGAGGSTRSFTHQLVRFIHRELGVRAVAHLTCVDHSVAEIDAVLADLMSEGIRHVLALRGDPSAGKEVFVPHPNGFSSARDLIKHIRSTTDLGVLAAGYPEGHKDTVSLDADMDYLKEKVNSGAEVVLTQLFFDDEAYFRFRDRAASAGIKAPIIPGVMPIRDVSQLERFTNLCGATIPSTLRASLESIRNDKEAVIAFGVDFCTKQCRNLIHGGAPGIHLYTLNKSNQVREILRALTQTPRA